MKCPQCEQELTYQFTDYTKKIEVWKCKSCGKRVEIELEGVCV